MNDLIVEEFKKIKEEFNDYFMARLGFGVTNIKGKNFMTPEKLGDVKSHDGHIVEISVGKFMNAIVFGVTFPLSEDHRSQACFSFDEVWQVIMGDNTDETVREEA